MKSKTVRSSIRYLFIFSLFVSLNIFCVKSQERPSVKANTTTLDAVSGGCTCSDQDSSGLYTPTVTSFNVQGVIVQKAFFQKVKNIVHVKGRILWQNSNSIGQGASATISLPIPVVLDRTTAFGTFVQTNSGSGAVQTSRTVGTFISQDAANMNITFSVTTTQSGGTLYYDFEYQIPLVQ